MTLPEFIARVEEMSGKDWKYIRSNWSWDHLNFKLDGYIKREERKREQQQDSED